MLAPVNQQNLSQQYVHSLAVESCGVTHGEGAILNMVSCMLLPMAGIMVYISCKTMVNYIISTLLLASDNGLDTFILDHVH